MKNTEKYIHVKNLETYHPGYKDRTLIWCKIYFTMINADPRFEMVEEIDKWRLVAFIMLELQIKRPVPLNSKYLSRKGFSLKKRPIKSTLEALKSFIEVVTVEGKLCNINEINENSLNPVTEDSNLRSVEYIKKSRVYKEEESSLFEKEFDSRWKKYPNKDSRAKSREHWNASIKTEKDLKDFDIALDNYLLLLKTNTWRAAKSGCTFFNNWRDFVDWKPKNIKPKWLEELK